MEIRQMLLRLHSIGIPDTVIAASVGVGRHTIWSIRTGRTKNCYSMTADKIRKLYEEKRQILNVPE